MKPQETQVSVARWAQETFGETPAMATATRMNIEVAELLAALADHDGLPEDHPLRLSLDRNVAQARQLARLAVETKSLRRNATIEHWEAVVNECGDVLVMLLQVAEAFGADLWTAMEHKMSVNRGRTWAKDEHGLSQHVSEPA